MLRAQGPKHLSQYVPTWPLEWDLLGVLLPDDAQGALTELRSFVDEELAASRALLVAVLLQFCGCQRQASSHRHSGLLEVLVS